MKVRRILFMTVLGVAVLLNGCKEKQTENRIENKTENKVSQEDSVEDKGKEAQGSKEAKDGKEAEDNKEAKDGKEAEDDKEARDGKEAEDDKEAKDGNETEDGKEAEDSNIAHSNNDINDNSETYVLEEDVDKTAEANQNAVAQTGYYKIISGSDGGYMVMVHDGEYSYGIQLLQEYLANMGCHAPNGMGGGWIDPDLDQYMCYARGDAIVPLLTEEDEEFWD